MNKKLSRRDFLRLTGTFAAGAALAACAPKATEAPATQEAPVVEKVEAPPTPTPGAEMATGAVVRTYEEGQAAYGWYDEFHPSSPVEITVWGPSGDETNPFIRSMFDAIDRFKERYPEIAVDYQQLPWDDLDTKVNAAVAAKQGPDIVWEADREGEYPRRGVVRPIDDILDAAYIKEHKFYEVRPLDDGHLYWVHTSIMGPLLYVNRELLAQEGLAPEDVPDTWDEFGRFAQQLTKWEGDQMIQAGCGFNGYARYLWNDMIYQQEAHCYSKTKSFVNSDESKKAWQTLLDFYDVYKINDRAFLDYYEGFGTGKSAISQVWTWYGSELAANYPDIDWVTVKYPTFDGSGPYGRFDYDGPGWMVTTIAEGAKLDAAREFFLFHCHDYQYLVERAHTQGMVLVAEPHPDYERLFAEVQAIEEPAQQDRINQSLAVLSEEFAGGMVFPGEVAAPFDDMWAQMEEAILYNNRPIEEVLTEYEVLYDEMLQNTNFWVTPEA